MGKLAVRWWKGALAVAAVILAVGALPAQADAGDAGRLLSLTNQVRASQGLPALTMDAQLTAVAQAWAAELAGRGVISHNPSVRSQVVGWKVLGENVGVGGTVDAVHAGFVASPTHYANLVDATYTKVGYGIVRPDARIFVVEVFMLPKTAAPAAPPAVTATPAPAAPVVSTTPAPTVAPTPPPVASELSPWMVHSMDRLRSLGSVTAA
jgi:hypothetical protein